MSFRSEPAEPRSKFLADMKSWNPDWFKTGSFKKLVFYNPHMAYEIIPWQPLGPLLKVKLLVGYMQNPTKLKGAKGTRLI